MNKPEVNDLLRFLEHESGMEDATPGQRSLWTGGLFLSHSGRDYRIILDSIVFPVVGPRFPGDGCFIYNRGSGGSWAYRKLVRIALNLCDKFLVVVSAHSVENTWVRAELAWALQRNRPIVVALLDSTQSGELSLELAQGRSLNKQRVFTVDFHNDPNAGQELAKVLDNLLQESPYTRGL